MKTTSLAALVAVFALAALHGESDPASTGDLLVTPISTELSVRAGESAARTLELSNMLTSGIDWQAKLLTASGGATDLAAAVAAIRNSGSFINGSIPNRYDSQTSLLQASSNSYATNLGGPLATTAGLVTASPLLGTSGRYATFSLPGLTLFAGDADGISSFQIGGAFAATSITRRVATTVIDNGGRKWSAFIMKVRLRNHSAQVFTVNQLMLVDQVGATQTLGTWQNQLQQIGNLSGKRRIYYAFFATNNGTLLPNEEFVALAKRLLDTAPFDPGAILSIEPTSGSIAANMTSSLNLRTAAVGAAPGDYAALLAIDNTGGTRLAEVPVTIRVGQPLVKPSLDRLDVLSVPGGPVDIREIALSATAGGTPEWSAEVVSQTAWLTLNNNSGNAPGALSIRINPQGLAAGIHRGIVRINAGTAITDLPVVLKVDPLVITQLRADQLRPQLYALNNATASGSVLVVSATDGSITKVIPVGINPRDASFRPDGAFLYTADMESRTISEIDLATLGFTRQREATLAIGSNASNLQTRFNLAAGKNGIIYHTDAGSSPSLQVFDFESGTVLATSTYGGGSLWYDDFQKRLYGHSQSLTISSSRIFALDTTKSPPEFIGRSSDTTGTGSAEGDSILRASITGDRLFSMRRQYQLPSMEPVGAEYGSDTRALSAYGHLRTIQSGIYDTMTNALIKEFPVGFPNYPRYSDFTMNQDAVVFFHPVGAAFEVLPIPEASRPPRIELVPTPAMGGILDYDSPILSWTALPFVEGYRVFIGTDAASVAAATAGSSEDRGVVEALNFQMNPPLPAGTVFYWKVDAIRGGQPVPGSVFQARMSPFRLAPNSLAWRLPKGTSPQSFSVAVMDGNDGLLAATASATVPWISIDASSGGPGEPLAGMIDPSGLAVGVHNGTVLITSGGESRELPVTVEIHALQLVKLAPDPTRPLVYGLHTGNASFDESQLLAIEAATGVIKKVVAVGRNATDFDIDPVADRLYVNNLNSAVVRVVDLAGFKQLDPLPAATNITGIESDHAGRLFVQRGFPSSNGFDILDAVSGAVLGNSGSLSAEGDRAELDPANGLYFVGQISSTYTLRIFDIHANPPVYLGGIGRELSSAYPPLLSPDGSRLFWQKRSYLPIKTPVAVMSGEAIATDPKGQIAVGENAVWWADGGVVAATLPFTSTASAIDASGRNLVLFNPANGTVSSIALETLVSLPGPQPQPGATIPHDAFNGLGWSPVAGTTEYRVYFSTSQEAVAANPPASAVLLGTVGGTHFGFETKPAWGHRYYWRVDAVTASGITRGSINYFDIPFPPMGEPLAFNNTLAVPGIHLSAGASLFATDYDGNTKSHAMDSTGALTFEQNIGGFISSTTTGYTFTACGGEGWLMKANDNEFSLSTAPPSFSTWSRDRFLGHWRQRKQVTYTGPYESSGAKFSALSATGGHVLAGLATLYGSSPGRVVSCIEWPEPTVIGSFQPSDTNWTFGSAIATQGNRALIGAYGGSSYAGCAYVYEFSPATTTWAQKAKLQPSTDRSSYAGTVVALGGDFAALSSGWLGSIPTRNKVYIYQNLAGLWSLVQTIDSATPSVDTSFGRSVAFHGDLLFISQYSATLTEQTQGIISVYRRTNGLWMPDAPLIGPPGTRGFGRSLVARDRVLYVGSNDKIHSYRLQPDSNRSPKFNNPPPSRLVVGKSTSLGIDASDPDGTQGLVISALRLPPGLSLVDHGGGRATLTGIPTSTAGSQVFAQWSVRDPSGATVYQSCLIGMIASASPPVFVRSPESVAVGEGQSVNLKASVGNDEEASWQWFKDNVEIEGANMPFLSIDEVSMDDAGSYHVSATNEFGTGLSAAALITVRPPDLDGGSWSTYGNSAARTGHHPATLGRVTFVPAWTRRVSDRGSLDQPVIADNRVFTGVSGTNSGRLFALDLHTGNSLWSFPAEDPANPGTSLPSSFMRGAPSWFDGQLYVHTTGTTPNGLHCLDAATGSLLRTSPITTTEAYSYPAITNSEIYLGGLRAFETDGMPRFRASGGYASVKQARLFTYSNAMFREHRTSDGNELWNFVSNDQYPTSAATIAMSDACALVVLSGNLLCIDTGTRLVRWLANGPFTGTPAIHGNTAYAIRSRGVTAFSLEDGTVTATYSTSDNIHSAQPLLLNDHLLVSGRSFTWVYRLATGELVQTIPVGGGILAYARGHLLVTGSGGILSAGHTLQAFFANSAPEFSSGAPKAAEANDAADPMTIRMGPFADDKNANDSLAWSIKSVSRPELFRTLEIDAQSGDLTVIYNPWQYGSSEVTLAVTDSASNVTDHKIILTVPPHPEPMLEVNAKITLNRQTGLYEHVINVTNSGAREIAGFDLTITGLPDGVSVNNGSEVINGTTIVHHHQTLAAGASATLILEYYAPIRGTVLDPKVAVSIVTEPDQDPVAAIAGLAVDRCLRQSDGSLLIEFTSVPGALYEIQYSENSVNWKVSPIRVRAAGNRVQWIDRGPPRTDSPPSQTPSRFYRVLQVPEAE